MKFLIASVLLQLNCFIYCFYIQDPVIQTPLGKLRGSILKTGYSQPVYQFLGIRYGRLADDATKSQPAQIVDEKWKDVYNATSYGTVCPLSGGFEDCFYLNIYTTKLPYSHKNTKRPVLVLLYPGGYSFGQKSEFEPSLFLDNDMIIVSANYRLSYIDGDTNDGKKLSRGVQDQALALNWVKINIEAFGGNPNSITVLLYNIQNFQTPLTDLVAVSDVTFMKVYVMTVEHA